jgi:hypothetical protein
MCWLWLQALWGEQEGVLPIRVVPVQDVCRASTPDVARLPAAVRRGRPPIQAVRLGSRVFVVSGGGRLLGVIARGWDQSQRAIACIQ